MFHVPGFIDGQKNLGFSFPFEANPEFGESSFNMTREGDIEGGSENF